VTAFERVKGNAIYTPSELAKRTEALPLTGRQLTDYRDMPGYAIPPREMPETGADGYKEG
jgi:hypothetical protein